MCVYVYMYMYVYAYVSVYVYMDEYMYVCIYVCMYESMYVFMFCMMRVRVFDSNLSTRRVAPQTQVKVWGNPGRLIWTQNNIIPHTRTPLRTPKWDPLIYRDSQVVGPLRLEFPFRVLHCTQRLKCIL